MASFQLPVAAVEFNLEHVSYPFISHKLFIPTPAPRTIIVLHDLRPRDKVLSDRYLRFNCCNHSVIASPVAFIYEQLHCEADSDYCYHGIAILPLNSLTEYDVRIASPGTIAAKMITSYRVGTGVHSVIRISKLVYPSFANLRQ